jgi:transcriptional regulator of heat shock response
MSKTKNVAITTQKSKINKPKLARGTKKETELLNRRYHILNLVVSQYLESGEPIASDFFCEHYDLDLSPASIRREFSFLTRDNYLTQLYHSAGRIPTDEALELFIDNFLRSGRLSKLVDNMFGSLNDYLLPAKLKQADKEPESFEDLVDHLAHESSNLTLGYNQDEGHLYRAGLNHLLNQLKTENPESLKQIMLSLEMLPQKLEKIIENQKPNQVYTYVGQNNPFKGLEDLSAITLNMPRPNWLLAILGPKYMAYDKNIALLQLIANKLS